MKTLRQVRTSKGYSLSKLAKVSNCDKAQLSRLENGRYLPSETTRVWLETILGEPIYFPILSDNIIPSASLTTLKQCSKRLRFLLKAIKSLPKEERIEFTSLAINYLTKIGGKFK